LVLITQVRFGKTSPGDTAACLQPPEISLIPKSLLLREYLTLNPSPKREGLNNYHAKSPFSFKEKGFGDEAALRDLGMRCPGRI
jgi:hypothetical protein